MTIEQQYTEEFTSSIKGEKVNINPDESSPPIEEIDEDDDDDLKKQTMMDFNPLLMGMFFKEKTSD